MLESHLIPRTDPVARKTQIYKGPHVRITVLTPRLIRVESGDTCTDLPSQIVWFRNLDSCPYDASYDRKGATVRTSEAEFFYNFLTKRVTQVTLFEGKRKSVKSKKSVRSKSVEVLEPQSIAGADNAAEVQADNQNTAKKIRINSLSEFNLKGTVRSLDNTMGAVRLGDGIISRSGVAALEDSSLLLDSNGLLVNRPKGSKDVYIFAHGMDYRSALRDFYKITGPVPLLPRAALGNWWSRWKSYTQDEYISLMQRFQKEHIPFSMATIDMDWHIVNVREKFPDYRTEEKSIFRRLIWGDGWTGYSWNRSLFPDYKGFLKFLHDNGFATILNLHPASGVRWFEDKYHEMASAMGIDPSTRRTINFDMSDPKFINAYFSILHRPYEKDGVDYWWVDWQQGRKSQQKSLDPLWALNHYHSLEAARTPDKRPFVLSRFPGPGGHRYSIGFSGDTMAGWRVLRFQPYFTATAANIGFTWWSHDIGGHWGGIKNDELYLRWLQFGVYSPINRLHSTRNDLMGKEVWNYRPDVQHYARRLLIRRHKFIPYLYTMNYRTHTQGIPVCEPLYYQYPNCPEAYKFSNQYFFGSELMVCPITKKSSRDMALSTVRVWIPEGRWTDITTGRIYEGGREIVLAREIYEIPVFARAGAIIPMGIEDEVFNTGLPSSLDLVIYRGTNTFTLYEDNGMDCSYKNGNFATTEFSVWDDSAGSLTVKINPAAGKGVELLPAKRDYKVILKDINHAKSVNVQLNGKTVRPVIKNSPLRVHLENIKPTDTVDILVENYTAQKNLPFGDEVVRLFSRLRGGNIRKMFKYRRVKYITGDKPRFEHRMRSLNIPKVLKIALKELIIMDN